MVLDSSTFERQPRNLLADDFLDGTKRSVEYVRVWNAPDWRIAAFVLGLPVALLALGSASYWVVNGFKRDPANMGRSA
jgi:hypothetical protein